MTAADLQTPTSAHVRLSPAVRLRAFVSLTKPRIIELLLVTTLPTMVVAARGIPRVTLMIATLAGGTLAAGGANATNMVVDRDIDAVMHRTAKRPLVTGAVSPRAALAFAVTLEVAAFALLWAAVNALSAVLAVAAAAFYIFVYTLWLKRASKQNIVIGGAAGAVPALVGWAAVTGRVGVAPLLLFALIFVWTPPHFWALAIKYRDDYRAVAVPMLPAVAPFESVCRQIIAYAVAVWAVSAGFGAVAHMHVIYWAVSSAAGAGFVGVAVRLYRDRTERRAMSVFSYSISYLTVLFVAMAVDQLVLH
jgi:protoheme IX farnesyltransferase